MLKLFSLSLNDPLPDRFNIAPGQDCLTVRQGPAGPEAALLRWGLVPHWAKDPSVGYRMINARSETAADKPSFRSAMRERRCLVAATAFYEWRGERPPKQPYAIHSEYRKPFAFAGLWERWGDPGQSLETFCILTRAADPAIAWLHDRMPVVVAPADFVDWLCGPAPAAAELLRAPTPFGWLTHPVSPRVNSADAEGPDLLKPVTTAPRQGRLF